MIARLRIPRSAPPAREIAIIGVAAEASAGRWSELNIAATTRR
jgi:hypothetical protein